MFKKKNQCYKKRALQNMHLYYIIHTIPVFIVKDDFPHNYNSMSHYLCLLISYSNKSPFYSKRMEKIFLLDVMYFPMQSYNKWMHMLVCTWRHLATPSARISYFPLKRVGNIVTHLCLYCSSCFCLASFFGHLTSELKFMPPFCTKKSLSYTCSIKS